ncbi:immunity protein Imm1 [Oleiphilus messinensis]|uniref:Immunity protein Imm1 n=1 Tax=Oleiphilus messinensis TaxID=141451 RepID=A0A1Y0I3B4_9GAMM|nr:Imm1 family immunity protein [Oleiphilus messinensis]ARU54286.1 immunity protein Imm1 [Oleiphilus messinensis]
MKVKAQWTDWNQTFRKEVSTYDEARTIIDRLKKTIDPPAMVEFFDNSKRAIAIGIGRNVSVVTYQDSLDPPYLISLGEREQPGTEWFCYGNEESEYLGRNLVSITLADNALKCFFTSNERPSVLKWEQLE